MKLQENMMTFTVFAAVVYGLWFYLAPASYFSLMMMPADLVNAVAINQLQNTGIGLFVLASVSYTHLTLPTKRIV